MTTASAADMRFNGLWVGETQGCDMPAHLWEITQHGRSLMIATRWEGEPAATGTAFTAWVIDGTPTCSVNGFLAVLVDPQHFIIAGWDTNDTRNGVGQHYDVVFSRPGIAELTAQRVWEHWRAEQPAAPHEAMLE
jgi:hypothetical protein